MNFDLFAPRELANYVKMSHIRSVDYQWLIDCLISFELLAKMYEKRISIDRFIQ